MSEGHCNSRTARAEFLLLCYSACRPHGLVVSDLRTARAEFSSLVIASTMEYKARA